MITQQINISFSSAMADTIRIHTAETGRVIVFIPDVLLEQDQSAEIIIVKPDNTFVIDDATIANGLITVTMPEQAGAVSGVGGYILKVYKDSLCVYSASGPLMVDDHLLTDGMIESVAEVHGLKFPDDFLTDDDIVINPTSLASATMTKIKYKGITYEVDGGAEDLDDLTDVTLTNPETGEVLAYDGQKWVNEALFIPDDLDDLDDVTITSPENGNVLQYDGTGWKNAALSIPDELSNLSDVAITSPAAGNVLTYNGAAWQNQNLTIPEDLDDLDDVEISAPSDGQQLVYNDGVWENQTITPVISKEATGNPIELTDAASAPMVKCVTQITGSQDLHGYDKPWVGGAGKNKWNEDYTGISSDITYKAIYVGNGTFTMSTTTPPQQGAAPLFFLPGNVSSGASTATNGVSLGTTRTIDSIDGYATVAYRAFSSEYSPENYETQVESGSTATSYAPYSNICPITAYNQSTISVGGKNRVKQIVKGYINTYTNAIIIDNDTETVLIKVEQGETYTFSSGATTNRNTIGYVGVDELVNGTPVTNIQTLSSYTWIAEWSGWTAWYVNASASAEVEATAQVEKGGTATAYEAPNFTTHTATFSNSIYQGNADFVGGTATTKLWKRRLKWGDGLGSSVLGNYTRKQYTVPITVYPPSADYPQMCSCAPYNASFSDDSLHFYINSGNDRNLVIMLPNDTSNDFEFDIVGELATPTTETITPTNLPIRTLSGYNHIESSTGDMEVEYITKTYEPIIKAMEQLIPANTRSIQSPIQNTIEETPQEIKKIVPEDEKEVGEEDAILRLTDEEGGKENADQRLTDE